MADFYIVGDADLSAARKKLDDFAKYVEGSFKSRVQKALNDATTISSLASNKSIGTDFIKLWNPINSSIGKTKQNIDGLSSTNLPRVRYALYDVAATANIASQAFLGFSTDSIKAAADYETAFTNVERTTMANIELLGSMRTQLEGLARQIPMTFANITEIASLGAQLGIATSDLTGFTKTVAEFSAVTNVSTQQAAQSFGSLGELLNISSDQYQNLGSAIAQVGVNSVATESEILSVSNQIAGVASSAGLTADYVVGLSGALASLRIPAEQSRGALTRVFQEINRSSAEGGASLQNFASIAGMSAEDMQKLINTQGGMEQYFTSFINGLSRLDSSQLTTALDSLNLSELRVTNTLTRLSRNTDLVARTQSDATQAYEDGTFLAAAYALKVEDLAAKFTILQNSLSELSATFGEAVTPLVGPIVDSITLIVQSLSTAFSTDTGKWAAGITVGASAVIGIMGATVAAIAMTVASLYALRTAIAGLGWSGAEAGMKRFIASLFGVSTASTTATASMRAASFAMKALPILAIITALGAMAVAFNEASKSAEVSFQKLVGDTTGLADAIMADTDAYNNMSDAQRKAAGNVPMIEYAGTSISNKYGDAAQQLGYTAQILGKNIPDSAYAASSAIEYNTRILGSNTQAWLNNMLMQNESFQKLVGNENFANFVEKTGYSVAEAFKRQAEIGGTAAEDYYYEIAKSALMAGKITQEEIQKADFGLWQQLRADDEVMAKIAPNGPGAYMGKVAEQFYQGINVVLNSLGEFGNFLRDMLKNIFNIDLNNAGQQVSQAVQGAAQQISILDLTNQDASSSTDDLTSSLGGLGGAAGGAAKKIYLLTDYANDLASIWERAGDIRFSGTETFDTVAKSLSDIAKATQDAIDNINELNSDIQSLNADRALQEYFLSVADAYGDALQGQKIRANLAKIDADLIKKTKDLQKAQDKTNKTLIGNSDAAIENRSTILDLVRGYQEHIKALAASGVKQDELRAITAQLKQDFIAQATQLGYNEQELQQYAIAFDDVTAAINNVPRDITVDFNGDAALTAIQEFAAKSREAIAGAGGSVKVTATPDPEGSARAGRINGYIASRDAVLAQIESATSQGRNVLYRQLSKINAALAQYGYADGGYTGAGGKYEVAGIVHRGEYVVPKEQVNQTTGLPYYMSQPRSFAQGGYTGQSGPTMVMLSPEDRALLRNAGGSGEVVLYANNEALARSVNAGNRSIVAAGGRP